MNLYLIEYDHQPYYTEAPSFEDAIGVWKAHVKELWGADYDGREEPESVQLLYEAQPNAPAVLRADNAPGRIVTPC